MVDIDKGLLIAPVNACSALSGDCTEMCTVRSPESRTTGMEHYSKAQKDMMFKYPWKPLSYLKDNRKSTKKLVPRRITGVLHTMDIKRKPEDIKPVIIKAAKEVFTKYGYRSTSFVKIIEEAKLSYKPSAISWHFKTKANLYKEVFGEEYGK